MGNAVTSIARHRASMIYWKSNRNNPLKKSFSYAFSYDCAAFVIPGKYGVFGKALQYFLSGKHERENNDNRNLSSV